MAEEREDEDAVQDVDRPHRPKSPPEHDAEAWRLWCEGLHVWSTIAAEVNEMFGSVHNHAWAERAVQRWSQIVEEVHDNDGISVRAEYLEGLKQDLAHQNSIAKNPLTPPQFSSAARQRVTAIRELIAAARGMVTKREGRDLSRDPSSPPIFEIIVGGNGQVERSSGGTTGASGSENSPEAVSETGRVPE